MPILNESRKTALLLILLLTFHISGLAGQISAERPRLILTPERVAALRDSPDPTHRLLWRLTIQRADGFVSQRIPDMTDAHNKYRYIGDTMPVLGLAYLLTSETRYLDASREWLSAVLSVPEWKGSQNLGRSAWATGCALLYDWLYDDLCDELRTWIRERLVAEAQILIEDASYWRLLSNHLFNETAALGLIGLALSGDAEEAEKFLTQAEEWTLSIIQHAPRDGSWGEGVRYWQYGLSHFILFLAASATNGRKDFISDYGWLKETGFFPIHFSLPGKPKEVLNFSDCKSRGYQPPFIMYQLASWYGNGFYQDYGDQILSPESHKFSWMDFIAYDPAVPPESIHTLPTLKHFSDNDFVTMRSGWQSDAALVGFRCGPASGHRNQRHPLLLEKRGFGPGHGHPDINSFCLFAYGEWLAIDPGYTHLKLTANHNTVLVNGHGQAGAGQKWLEYMEFVAREPASAILRVESNPVYDYVLGDAGNIYVDEAELQSFRRHLLFLKPDMVVIADDLEGKIDSRFEWLIHGRESITQTGDNHFEIIRNGVRLWVYPILPDDYRAVIQERELDALDVDGYIVTLKLEVESARQTRYLVLLCALKEASSTTPRVAFDGETLKIQHSGKDWVIKVLKPSVNVQPSDAILVLKTPKQRESAGYSFIRD